MTQIRRNVIDSTVMFQLNEINDRSSAISHAE